MKKILSDNQLEFMSDDVLNISYKDTKDSLFNLYQKIDITLIRLGLMALSIHDKKCNYSEILDLEDLLFQIRSAKNYFFSYSFEKARRDGLKKSSKIMNDEVIK